jgi:uncharacterized protein
VAAAEKKIYPISDSSIEQFCQRHFIRRLAFFGSVLRDDFRLDSDVDVLVEFEPGHAPGYDFFLIETELAQLLGRKVDLETVGFLSPEIRKSVIREAVVAYEQA